MSAMLGNVHTVLLPATGRCGGPTQRPGRVGGLVLLALVVFLAPHTTTAQQPGKMARVGFLGITAPDCATPPPSCQAMAQGLQDLGYVEGQNLVIEFRSAEGHVERLPALAAAFVQRQVDVLVAGGPEAVLRAARDATSTIPIVMVAVDYDPIALGYIAGLPRPGGQITAYSSSNSRSPAKVSNSSRTPSPKSPAWPCSGTRSPPTSSARRQRRHGRSGCNSTRSSCATRRPTITPAPCRPPPRRAPSPSWCCGPRCSGVTATVSSPWRRSTGCRRCSQPGCGLRQAA